MSKTVVKDAHPSRLAVPAVRQLAPYIPGKPIGELTREYGVQDIIKLASNENPYGPSSGSLAAMRQALDGLWLYPDGSSHDLKAALAEHLSVDPACITLGNGSNDLLVLLAESFLTPATNAIYSQHGFAIYPLVIRATGARVIEVPALGDDSSMPLGHDLDAMLASIDAQTRLVFIANPNNPTGTWAQPDAVREFVRRAGPDTLVVLDEAYFEYGRLRGTQDGIAWLTDSPNLVVTRTFSKAYGLAGARVGYAVSHPDVADVLNRLRAPFNVNSIAQAGALAALADAAHMQRSTEATMRELARVEAAIKTMNLWSAPSATNFLLLRTGVAASQIYDRLLRDGVIVRPIGGLPDALRISIGMPAQNDRMLAALKRAMS
ncbi:MAG TPA: histidinol-phosphate transaminase [Steroidobacteraceae bacterium]|nr:histidinol-phosphate transaminase [Steroidobacteraceae bacterium]